VLEDFFVLRDGVRKLSLLNELLRSAEDFLLIEPETKRHKIADSDSVLLPVFEENEPSDGRGRQALSLTIRTRVIVRLASQNRMVTKDYHGGLYNWGEGKLAKREIRLLGAHTNSLST